MSAESEARELLQVLEIPFSDAPSWVQVAWNSAHPQHRPRVHIKRTEHARIGMPWADWCTRDICAHNDSTRETQCHYVPTADSAPSSSMQEQALFRGGELHLSPGRSLAVLDNCGDRGGRSIDLYVHPDDFKPAGLLPPTLTDRQRKILATVRGLISSARKEVFQLAGVQPSEFEELQKMGLLDKRNAITIMGRNVSGRDEPWSTYALYRERQG